MKSKETYILSILFLLLLSGCGVRNLFTTKGDHDPTRLPNDSSEVNSGNPFISQQIESPVFSSELMPLDSVILLNTYRISRLADSLLDYAKLFIGKPYIGGGNGPNGFDCSGFTKFVFGRFGHNLFRTSEGQMLNGTPIKRQADLRPGDLVFYSGRKQSKQIGHVGIVVENDPETNIFTFIHAACQSGVTISKSNEPYYIPRYVSACRVLDENDAISTSTTSTSYKAKSQEENKQTSSSQTTTEYHTIKKGDTLTKIAKSYNTTVKKLCKLNHINQNKTLQIGEKIKVK